MARPRTLILPLLVLGVGIAACAREPNVEERAVYVYSPRACPVAQSTAYSVLYAGGDFQPSQENAPIARLFLSDVGRAMTAFPEATRSIVVDVSQQRPEQEGEALRWWGFAEVPKAGPVNVLVWPVRETCDLTRNVDVRAGSTLAVFGRHLMVAGGTRDDGSNPLTFVGDLSTGILEGLDLGLLVKRTRPSITPFRADSEELPSAALVAGGEDAAGEPLDNAEIYVPKVGAAGDLGDFDRTSVRFADARKDHGAVVLASGATALIGGTGRNGKPLRSIEVIDPVSRQSRSDGLRQLAIARTNPAVLRLANGEIMVAGGTDAQGGVKAIEWFPPDLRADSKLTSVKRPADLVTGRERAIVPLPAGGALAVVAPEDKNATNFQTVFVISSEGGIEPGIPVDPAELDSVRLFDGAGGAPVLWTGKRWLRWQPWYGAFEAITDAPPSGPSTTAIASGDSGLALWLEERTAEGQPVGMYVAGWRFAARPRFDAVNSALLVDTSVGLVPDRIPGVGRSVSFDPARGLVLGTGAAVFVPDLTFADFRVELDIVSAAPEIVLRPEGSSGVRRIGTAGDVELLPELAIGGAACAFGGSATKTLAVERRGKEVRVILDGREERTCPAELDASGRVSLGLRGAGGTASTGARNLRVIRR
jgi:hypothetical protein